MRAGDVEDQELLVEGQEGLRRKVSSSVLGPDNFVALLAPNRVGSMVPAQIAASRRHEFAALLGNVRALDWLHYKVERKKLPAVRTDKV